MLEQFIRQVEKELTRAGYALTEISGETYRRDTDQRHVRSREIPRKRLPIFFPG